MLFRWLKYRRRRHLLAEPFPHEWDEILAANVRHFRDLGVEERRKLRDVMRIFIAEKNWEGCGGLELTDEIKVTIAAQACLLVLGFDDVYFDHVLSILVYPTSYVVPEKTVNQIGVETEDRSNRLGEAWYRGPVILSWEDALASGRNEAEGHNVVLHEFAHQLDMIDDRSVDGTPPLVTAELHERWTELIHEEYEQLKRDCRRREWTVLDCYGTTNIGEFFAVATESFFEEPAEVAERHPELYALFCEFYRQDPAKRGMRDEG
ncbi:MAG: M90 family metallopeptidase [Planctomycetaceae bacterium]